MVDYWLQNAIKREERVRNYLRRVYGKKAFHKDGTIKMKYLDKAIRRVEYGKGRNKENLLDALRLAKRLKRMRRKKRRRR